MKLSKKLIGAVLVVLLCVCVVSLYSCQESEASETSDNQDKSQNSLEIPNGVPTDFRFYYLDSYSDLEQIFSKDEDVDANENVSPVVKELLSEKDKWGDTYFKWLDQMAEQKKPYLHKHNGELMPLMDSHGRKVSICTSELFGLPQIWYYHTYNGENMIITQCYWTVYWDNLNDMNYSDLSRVVRPNYTNVHNYQYTSTCKNAYVKEMQVGDQTVEALVLEYTDDPRLHVSFIYNDMILVIRAMPSLFESDFFEGFSIE